MINYKQMRSTINLYNKDCLPAMRKMADNQYALAIVDPPYGIKRFETGGSIINKYGDENREWNNIKPQKEYFNELFRISKNQIIWGANNFELPISEYFIVWQKGNALDFSFAMVEQAWTNIKKPAKLFIYLHVRNKEKRFHPTQKPVALYKWLLKNYAKPGYKIIDTHFGSLSIGIACWDAGYDLDAYEIDKDYFEAGKKRLENHKAQLQISYE